MSIAGEPKSIKNLRSGDLLIQCAKEAHEKNLLQMKTFCGLKCSVTPHSSLNTSKGIIRCPALNRVTSDDIKEGMVEQGVTDVRRITVRRDGETKLTNTYVLTFNSPTLPTVVKIGFMQVKVDVYIPNPLRCYSCQVFGHHENKCGRHPVCCNCGEPEHCGPSGVCNNHPNVSTAQVITLQTRSNAHNGRKRRKFSKSNVKTTYHFLMLVNNTSNFTQVKLMQVLLNQALATNLHKLKTKPHRQTTALTNTKNRQQRKHKVQRKNVTHLLNQEKVTPLILGQPLRGRP